MNDDKKNYGTNPDDDKIPNENLADPSTVDQANQASGKNKNGGGKGGNGNGGNGNGGNGGNGSANASNPNGGHNGKRGPKILPVKLTPPGVNRKTKFAKTFKAIRKTNASFLAYKQFLDDILDPDTVEIEFPGLTSASLLFNTQAYNVLKFATEQFVTQALSTIPNPDRTLPPSVSKGVLPYYEQVLVQLDAFPTDLDQTGNATEQIRLRGNRTELIWSYWMEEGMLVQTMNAIALRFQNIAITRNDPLANLEMDTLRPLSNILFGYIQDTQNRLTISRRNHEYMYEYGIRLFGDAVPNTTPVAVRTTFIETFHSLLYQCIEFYRLVDDLTKNADAYPLLNTLQEVNLLLMHGMHNQYNDLSVKARSEMLLEQWILSRKEINEFLHGKPMVIYDEPWMSAVDAMKDLQGWPGQSIRCYQELAEYGEDILLSIRFADWNRTYATTEDAKTWALLNREGIQRYIHNYKSVTGVDIAEPPSSGRAELKAIMPGVLISQRFRREKMLKRG